MFSIGVFGLLQQNSLIGMLIATELILNGAGMNFMAFNMFLTPDPMVGQIFTLLIMGVAAAEAAIALSIIIVVYRRFKEIRVDGVSELKG
jgi:NADH:ubiquinone oxidoreductase subunit K